MVKGLVYLAGAGPGDAKLLTLRVAELLVKVDIVLYDKLVGKKILSMIPKKTQRLYVGRVAGDDPSNQDTYPWKIPLIQVSQKMILPRRH